LLSVFEGVGVLISRVFNDNTRPQLPPCACDLFGLPSAF
jgi:import inner membrane translocase subunit TIM17